MKARIYFESLGRSAQARGQLVLRPLPKTWPLFAKQAYLTGYLRNSSLSAIIKMTKP